MISNELKEKEARAIKFLQAMERPEGYHLAFSGGKDSVVIKHLADKAGIKYRAVYRVTSVDPPELVRFIKEEYPEVERETPRYDDGTPITMWNLIPKKGMLPTRLVRYCCEYLKESAGDGQMTITGVRWAESTNRKKNQGMVTLADKKAGKELADDPNFSSTNRGGVVLVNDNEESRRQIESCYKRHKTMINPIIDWEDSEVWEYIREEKIKYCPLYDEGYTRLGCIGCPMGRHGSRARDFARYPKYKEAYMRAIERMLKRREEKGLPNSRDAESYFHWWIEDPNIEGQMSIDFDGEEDNDD